jgi:hypothetical protein
MEEYTYVPIAIKTYFDFNKLGPFKKYEPLDALYSTKDAEAFADGAELALEMLLNKVDSNGFLLTNYEIKIVELKGKFSIETASKIIEIKDEEDFKRFTVKKEPLQ